MNTDTSIDSILDDYQKGIKSITETKMELEALGVIDTDEAITLHQAAARAIQRHAIRMQVKNVQRSFTENMVKKPEAKIVQLQPFRFILRIAAIVILVAGGWFAYQYNAVSSDKLYAEIYQPYQVNTNRANIGEIIPHQLIQQYKDKNYPAVINTYLSLTVSNNREKFLTAMAYHESGGYEKAIDLLLQIQAYNKQQGTRLYADEAEFFSALCYLKLNNGKAALPLFENIYNNRAHTFNERVSRWTIIRLRWIK